MSGEPKKHWLDDEANIKKLWRGFIVVLVLTAAGDVAVHHHKYFGPDGWPGFYSVYGFITCMGMILIAKALKYILHRVDTHYDD